MGVPKIDPGSIPAYGPPDTTDDQVATVQAGETSLSQVAHRLGLDSKSLLEANPQIKDPAHLKAGQDINLPHAGAGEAADSGFGGSISTLLASPSGPSPQGSSDPMAKAMVQMQFDASPAKGASKSAEHAREQRLNDLVSDPGAAHKAWKSLSPQDRNAVLERMKARFGKGFADQFLEIATKGKPQPGIQNYQPGTGPTSEELKARGYHLESKVRGNLATEVDVWVHPSGKIIMKDVSTSKPGGTGAAPTPITGDGPARTGGPASVDPTSDVEGKQNKALEILGKLQDNVQGIRDLMEKQPVPWDQVRLKFAHCQDEIGELKKLGASSDASADRTLDMSDIDGDFYTDLDQANQELLDLRGEASEKNPDFESFMQQPYVDEPEASE